MGLSGANATEARADAVGNCLHEVGHLAWAAGDLFDAPSGLTQQRHMYQLCADAAGWPPAEDAACEDAQAALAALSFCSHGGSHQGAMRKGLNAERPRLSPPSDCVGAPEVAAPYGCFQRWTQSAPTRGGPTASVAPCEKIADDVKLRMACYAGIAGRLAFGSAWTQQPCEKRHKVVADYAAAVLDAEARQAAPAPAAMVARVAVRGATKQWTKYSVCSASLCDPLESYPALGAHAAAAAAACRTALSTARYDLDSPALADYARGAPPSLEARCWGGP